jgi:hypothetical protein
MTVSSIRWVYAWPRDGATPEFRLGRWDDALVAEWVGLGTLVANRDGTRRELRPTGTMDAAVLEHVLARPIAALLRHLRGGVSLHASGVAYAGVALAFLGPSCAGKSTLATQLCEAPDVELVADDTAALDLDGPFVAILGGETDHSLRPDIADAMGLDASGHRKLKKPARRTAAGPVRLGACVNLVFDPTVAAPVLRRVGGVEAFTALSLAIVRFALDDEAILQRELDHLARVAEEAPVYELRRPRNLASMAASARKATQLLSSLS